MSSINIATLPCTFDVNFGFLGKKFDQFSSYVFLVCGESHAVAVTLNHNTTHGYPDAVTRIAHTDYDARTNPASDFAARVTPPDVHDIAVPQRRQWGSRPSPQRPVNGVIVFVLEESLLCSVTDFT